MAIAPLFAAQTRSWRYGCTAHTFVVIAPIVVKRSVRPLTRIFGSASNPHPVVKGNAMFRVVAFIVLGSALASPSAAQTARDYFNELYKAGGLDASAAQYVCFDDRPQAQSFFIFSESRVYKDLLTRAGKFGSLSQKDQAELKMGFLTYRGYDKGVPFSDELFLAKDVDSWATKAGFYMNSPLTSRLRVTVAWQTLRYRQTIETLAPDSTIKAERSTYGRCELIPDTVPQKAN